METAGGMIRLSGFIWRLAAAGLLAAAVFQGPGVAAQETTTSYSKIDEETLRRMAKPGDLRAQFYLGARLSAGNGGTERNPREAVIWLRKSADQGFPLAQFSLGILYEQGEGVTRNSDEALRWYQAAADQGYALAQYNLAVMYEKGDGIPTNPSLAGKWYMAAAEQGQGKAQYNLGCLYMEGRGVGRDLVESYKWMCLAEASGNELAIKGRKLVEALLSKEDRQEGRKRAEQFTEFLRRNKTVTNRDGAGK